MYEKKKKKLLDALIISELADLFASFKCSSHLSFQCLLVCPIYTLPFMELVARYMYPIIFSLGIIISFLKKMLIFPLN